MARIRYIEKDDASEDIADLFNKMESRGARVVNLWKTAAHSPSTLIHLIRLGNALLSKTRVAPKLREIAILRVASILDCEYERRSHAVFGKEAGMTDEQVRAIGDWENHSVFDRTERAVLAFTDQVTKYARVSDETFSELAALLDEGMMTELVLTTGFYGMLARILLTFQVDLDDDAPSSVSQATGRS